VTDEPRDQGPLKALIVSFHFPPDGAIGGVRPYRLARHLPEHGIEPWILTVTPEFAEQPNPAWGPAGIPPERIVRVPIGRTIRDPVLRLWRGVRRSTESSRSQRGRLSQTPHPVSPRRLGRLRDWLLEWLLYPDALIGWHLPATRAGALLHARVGFDVMLSTSPPRVATLVASCLHQRCGIPWVMDLRDPWQMKWSGAPAASRTIDRLQGNLFGRSARAAAMVVYNSERVRRHASEALPWLAAKSHCIPNGYEPDWTQIGPSGPNAGFRVSHYGHIMGRRSASVFLRGLRLWLDRTASRPPELAVQFIGTGFEGMAAELGLLALDKTVTLLPPMPRASVRELISEDFVLVILANDQPLQVPGKTYDYLASGRRILALTESDSAAAEVLHQIEGCALAQEPGQVALSLDQFYREYAQGASQHVDRAAFLRTAGYPHRVAEYAGLLRCVARHTTL
jgi:hypothetical protein